MPDSAQVHINTKGKPENTFDAIIIIDSQCPSILYRAFTARAVSHVIEEMKKRKSLKYFKTQL